MVCNKEVNNGLYGFCIFIKTDVAAILTDAFWLSIWLNLKFIYIFTFYWLIKFTAMYLSGSAHSKPEEDNIFARAQQHIAMQVRHILLASVFLLVFHSLLLSIIYILQPTENSFGSGWAKYSRSPNKRWKPHQSFMFNWGDFSLYYMQSFINQSTLFRVDWLICFLFIYFLFPPLFIFILSKFPMAVNNLIWLTLIFTSPALPYFLWRPSLLNN